MRMHSYTETIRGYAWYLFRPLTSYSFKGFSVVAIRVSGLHSALFSMQGLWARGTKFGGFVPWRLQGFRADGF